MQNETFEGDKNTKILTSDHINIFPGRTSPNHRANGGVDSWKLWSVLDPVKIFQIIWAKLQEKVKAVRK